MKRPGAWLTAACLLLLALNLRPLFPSTAILLPELKQALHLSGAQAGYLTTLPVLCMGLFAHSHPAWHSAPASSVPWRWCWR